MLRAVLLCDIVNSTALVEQLGDVRAVHLMQRHDALMRQALTLCHGQLIDKADGVLALFERPIQALDFALRYQRGLRELGTLEGVDLKARIGLHVGDVMTWANEPKHVLAGAKAFEVEGLAKPVAARLMNLALPGQILMSGMAQNLCHRAVGELGDAGVRLRWLMHGRYSFKGVPAPMLVHEVGEPGLSPLRAPDSGAKAWRELPLWRRPPVIALQVLALGTLGAVLFWSTLRSPPAIAFAERDWLVVADLQNRTGEAIFDDSLDTALRVGLEQSRHINLVSELQVERTLERMQRKGQALDRQLAVELALREGAKAVILPTIAEVGGMVRVSLEVIDPGSGVTVYSQSADGRGADDILPALDNAMTAVRGSLGEAMANIQDSSMPLEQATTGNLEALRAFSLHIKAKRESRFDDAMVLLNRAVELDPQFAMAHVGLFSLSFINGDNDLAKAHLDRAQANRSHLSQREALLLDASQALFGAPEDALRAWKLWAAMYPDEYRAYYNYAYFAVRDAQRYRDARDFLAPALVSQNPARMNAYYLLGEINVALNDFDAALAAFEQAQSLGVRGFQRGHAEAYAARRDFAGARKVLGLQTATGKENVDLDQRLAEVSFALDQGQWSEALAAADELADAASRLPDGTDDGRWRAIALSLRAYLPDPEFKRDLASFLDDRLARLPAANALDRRQWTFELLAAGWMAAHAGDIALSRRALDASLGKAELFPANAAMAAVVEAEIALAEGRPQQAADRLRDAMANGHEIYFTRAVYLRALMATGADTEALAQATWLVENRGLAYAEYNANGVWQPTNVLESGLALDAAARLAERTGNPALAQAKRAAFAAAWPGDAAAALVERRAAGLD